MFMKQSDQICSRCFLCCLVIKRRGSVPCVSLLLRLVSHHLENVGCTQTRLHFRKHGCGSAARFQQTRLRIRRPLSADTAALSEESQRKAFSLLFRQLCWRQMQLFLKLIFCCIFLMLWFLSRYKCMDLLLHKHRGIIM